MRTNSTIKRLLLVICLAFLQKLAFTQWIEIEGLYGGKVSDIFTSGEYIIVSAGNAGVYRSNDNGENWAACNIGLPNDASIQSIVGSNDSIYASIYGDGVYMSADNGSNWTAINSTIESQTFYSLIVNDATIYAGSGYGGVFCTFNGGITWENKSSGIASDLINDFAFFNSKIYAGGTKLYESSNNGDSWEEVAVPSLDPNGIRKILIDENYFHIAGGDRVHTSGDSLKSWSISQGFGGSIVSMGTYDNNIFFTTHSGQIYTSNDHGLNWTKIQNTNTNSFVYDALFLSNQILMTTDDGIFKSTDGGSTWLESNTGLGALQIQAFGSDNSYIYVGTLRQGMYQSGDLGDRWVKINAGLNTTGATNIKEIITCDNSVFIATEAALYSSNNNGIAWEVKFTPQINESVQTADYNDGLFAFAVGGKGVYVSTNLETWNLAENNGLNKNTGYESIKIIGDSILLSTHDGEIFLSTNRGSNWQDISIPGDFYFTYKLEYYGDTIFAATPHGLYYSDNLGANWNLLNEDGRSIQDIVIAEDKIYAASESGIYIYEKKDKTWYTPSISGVTDKYIIELMLYDEFMFAGTFSGAYIKSEDSKLLRCPLGTLENEQTSFKNQIDDLRFSINIYPNPSEEDATIEIESQFIGQGRIELFDLKGQLILLREFDKNTKSFEKRINLKNISSGMYIINIILNDNLSDSKLFIVK